MAKRTIHERLTGMLREVIRMRADLVGTKETDLLICLSRVEQALETADECTPEMRQIADVVDIPRETVQSNHQG